MQHLIVQYQNSATLNCETTILQQQLVQQQLVQYETVEHSALINATSNSAILK